MRNSVKATVDAYTGQVDLYENDPTDPVLKTWEKVFPGTVKPAAEIPPDLRAHFRYPEGIFKVQRDLLTRYHVHGPERVLLDGLLLGRPVGPDERRGGRRR